MTHKTLSYRNVLQGVPALQRFSPLMYSQSRTQLTAHVRSSWQASNQSSQNCPHTGRPPKALGKSMAQWATFGEHLYPWKYYKYYISKVKVASMESFLW